MALGARFLKETPWHYNSGKEVAISLPPECHLLEKTLRDECSGLSAIVDFIKLILLLCSGCGYVWMRAKTFSRSPLGCLYREADKRQKCHVLPADFSAGHGEDGGVT